MITINNLWKSLYPYCLYFGGKNARTGSIIMSESSLLASPTTNSNTATSHIGELYCNGDTV